MPSKDTSSPVSNVTFTGDHNIDALIYGQKWTSSIISYSVPTSTAVWSNDPNGGYGLTTSDGEPWNSYTPLNEVQTAQFKVALQGWANVANLQFVQSLDNTSTVGDIRIGFTKSDSVDGAQAIAYLPDGSPIGGDIWFNADSTSFGSAFEKGSYSYLTMLHELGHTLGLKHPFESGGASPSVIDTQFDSKLYTVMSYSADPGNQDTMLSFYPTTPMVYDILAMQSMYGANHAYNAGDTTYTFVQGQTYLETIWDGGGNNTISYSGSNAVSIDLREGHGSTLGVEVDVLNDSWDILHSVQNVWIAYGTHIQTAIGGRGFNTIEGNELNNQLIGGDAGNIFTGCEGNDLISGGAGIDTSVYTGQRSNYTVTGSATTCTVTDNSGTDGIDTLNSVERLNFSDESVAFDITGKAGMAYRLYQAAFDRAPDLVGLGYWIKHLDEGLSGNDVAYDFSVSDEFKLLYGTNVSNTDFVTHLYENVLHREPEKAGYDYWVNVLNTGLGSRQVVLVSFSESPENQAQVIGEIQHGIDYIPYA
jgi:serralysin